MVKREKFDGVTPRHSDSVGAFLARLRDFPLLTAEEEILLRRKAEPHVRYRTARAAKAAEAAGEEDTGADVETTPEAARAFDTMVMSNVRFVVSIAKRYQNRGLDLLELIQEGCNGLVLAVEKFDPERGNRFSTVAFWWIRQSITRALATKSRTIRLPSHVWQMVTELKRVTREFRARKGRKPTIDELAAILGKPPEVVRDVIAWSTDVVSYDRTAASADGDHPIIDLIADDRSKTTGAGDEWPGCDYLLLPLTSRERDVIVCRFGLEGGGVRSFSEVGTLLGVTPERARQLTAKALRKLKCRLVKTSPEKPAPARRERRRRDAEAPPSH